MSDQTLQADVVVVGGGMSGTVSAIAAARAGVDVVLIEKQGFLGGTATACMLGEMNGFALHGKRLFGGIFPIYHSTQLTERF